ncbi:transposase [Paenibacillus sp. P25]|nr:transposase [Paenibacillus sp. P25]
MPGSSKKDLVVEVLSGYRTEVVARKYGMAPKTLSNWVRQYQDEVGDLMAKKRDEEEKIKEDAAKFKELQEKYDEAMKLLGQKELENSILRDLVKKSIPTGSSLLLDRRGISGSYGAASVRSAPFHLLLPPSASGTSTARR